MKADRGIGVRKKVPDTFWELYLFNLRSVAFGLVQRS